MIKTDVKNLIGHLKNDLSIEPESLVWLHSSIMGLGLLKGGINIISNAFEKVLSEGALVIPTFTYSWNNNKSFDIDTTECPDVGNYASNAWKDSRFNRTNNPNFSVSVMDNTKDGQIRKEICHQNFSSTCFGSGSVFEKMYDISLDRPSYILLIGGAHNDVIFRTTFIHMVEENVGVPYRYGKLFFDPKNKKTFVEQYVRYLSTDEYIIESKEKPPFYLKFPVKEKYYNLGNDISNNGILTQKKFAYSISKKVKTNHFCDWLREKLNVNPIYLLD